MLVQEWLVDNIESKEQVLYLGITIDQSLSGDAIANKVISKCSNTVKFLYRNARQLALKTKKLIASTLSQCHLTTRVHQGIVDLLRDPSPGYKWHKIRLLCLC